MKRMEQENITDFKAIRAKFQEEITLNQYRRKPMVPEKPRQVPLPPGACPSHLSTIAVEIESNSSVLPRAKKHGKRPVSYPLPLPPCTPSLFSGKTAEKEQSTRQTSKDKRLSLGLPVPGKEQKVTLGLPSSSCLPPGQPEMVMSAENDVKSTSPKTSGISLDTSSRSKSPSNSPEMTSGSPSPRGRGCLYSRSTSAPSVCSAFEDTSVRHSTLSSEESAQGVNVGSPEASSPPWLPLKVSPKLSPMGCENPKAEAPPQKPKSISQATSVSALAAKLNIASHWKMPHIRKNGADWKTNCLRLGHRAETGPAKIPLPGLQSLGPPPEKPPRPHLVDLSHCWALFGKDQHEIGFFGVLESIDFEGQAPEYPVPPKPQDLVCPELSGIFNVAFNALESQSIGSGDQSLHATDLEPREPKSAVLEALGLWTKESTPALDPPDQAPPAQNFACITERQHKDGKPLAGLGSERHSENADVYEDVEITNKLRRGQNTWRRKVIPKNPYADTDLMGEDSRKSAWFHNPCNGRKENRESNEDREQKKREKKERREREKKENEMRRKFKITGQEEPMYKATVTVASKGRKGDLPVQTGDVVSIIRTTDCPKGKWLARDDDHKYGYIPVMNVELDIKEMLELGKRASQAAGRPAVDGDTFSDGSRSSNQCPAHSSSFTDSEEWTCDEESILSPSDVRLQSQNVSMAEMCYANGKGQPAASNDGYEDSQALTRYEALQKLATFFQQQQQENESIAEENAGQTPAGTEVQPSLCSAEEHTSLAAAFSTRRSSEPEGEFQLMDLIILPPPAPFADRG
ncbi:uncharacterized protein [Paramormyrops kingsleyae]|uniref:uncharacterized protein isoform X2 n=1 Tax=Paramormyrops kingsleyae TaxID=1676925 RepID=UPI000CD5F28B|nr:FYN-binding protein 1-like isoform X2 [Paramormyrops kingsleyae]